ncbi:MAG: 8-amino-7-oxononanoate synthase [Gammaproteobacteria bacterium]|nr:MAG: 8-amino-7-oxononanoate synthase [Gammaproteobacteria bacterium]
MSLFDKFQPLIDLQSELEGMGVRPFGAVTEKLLSATEGVVNGRQVVLAGTNNYLGLTFDPECVDAAHQATLRYGTGTTGSRMANGNYAEHVLLESELADFFSRQYAIIFSTGYAATMGMAATLAGAGDVILLDSDSHASIYDGVRLGGADVIRFQHNNVQDLDKRLRRLGDSAKNALIIVEGIYSMQGDRAPLADIVEVKCRHGAMLMVDEAHSLGIVGERGRGVAEEAGVEDGVDFVVGTFSKSLGATGGYCVSNHPALEAIRYAVRSYIFTASPAPSVVASTRAALRIIRERPELREKLWANARHLYDGLKQLNLAIGSEISPVVAVTCKDRAQAICWWSKLFDSGVYVNLVIPPASPSGKPLLRCSVSAAHSAAQIQAIIDAFEALIDMPLQTIAPVGVTGV